MLGLPAVMAIGGNLHGTLLAAYTYIIIYINNILHFMLGKTVVFWSSFIKKMAENVAKDR